MKDIVMKGVREYAEEMDVELIIHNDRIVIHAQNEAGYNCTLVDFADLMGWVQANKPELLED